MILKVEVNIGVPVHRAAELFGNADNTPKWMNGLRSVELLNGELGEPGSRSKVVVVNGFTTLKMVETVLEKDLPEQYVLTYESDTFNSRSTNRFFHVDERTSRFVMEQHIEFKGALKMAGFLAKNGIKGHMMKNAQSFRRFAEGVGY